MNVIDYVSRKFEADGTGEFSPTMTPIEGLLWELLCEAKRLREPRPLNPVDQLAIQTSYVSVAFVAAHLREYFEAYEEAGTEPDIPRTTLDAANRAAAVLDRMRPGDGSEWGER